MKFVGPDLQRQADGLSAFAGGSSDPLDLTVATPATPPADTVRLFRRKIGGRNMPAFLGPDGQFNSLQPLVARNKIGVWSPPGNSTTAPGVFGMAGMSTTGTATARNVATTNLFTRLRRLGYVSGAAAGSFVIVRQTATNISLGTTIGGIAVGGFFKVIRFGVSDAATVAGARTFVGINNGSAPSTGEPSTLTNVIGVGNGASDTNLFLYYGGSAAQTPINLGANFPANTLSVDAYELALFCAPGSETVTWQVTRLNTGDTASGTLSGASGVALPAPSTLLSHTVCYRYNNATALAVGIDLISDYIETDM
jgi:hypothetical protein